MGLLDQAAASFAFLHGGATASTAAEGGFLSWVSAHWLAALERTTWSDAAIFTAGTYLIHQAMGLVFAAFYTLAHYRNWFPQYRIQKDPAVDMGLLKVSVLDYVKRALVTEAPTIYLLYKGFHHFGTVVRGPLPGWGIIARDLVLCWLWTETTFYWSHRLFHHRLIYKHIHKRHHEFKKSMAINTEYAHPLEHLISNVLTTFGAPLLLGTHTLVFWFYLFFRLWETFDAHSGYTIPVLSPFSAIPFWTGPRMHDFHHSHNVGSYGTMTCFWDWITGTDEAYRKYVAKQKEEEAQSGKAKKAA